MPTAHYVQLFTAKIVAKISSIIFFLPTSNHNENV